MPKGPKGEKRPRDPNQRAKRMTDIVPGDVEDRDPTPEEQGKDPAAVFGSQGGEAPASSLTKKRRSEIARKAAAKRWQG